MWNFGLTPEKDRELEENYVAHEKGCAGHVMLVALGSCEQYFCELGRGMRRLLCDGANWSIHFKPEIDQSTKGWTFKCVEAIGAYQREIS